MALLLTEDVKNMTDEQKELLRGALEARISANRLFELLPFDGIPGGDLTYKKKKDDDNGEADRDGDAAD